jgi:hypothetical protein
MAATNELMWNEKAKKRSDWNSLPFLVSNLEGKESASV